MANMLGGVADTLLGMTDVGLGRSAVLVGRHFSCNSVKCRVPAAFGASKR